MTSTAIVAGALLLAGWLAVVMAAAALLDPRRFATLSLAFRAAIIWLAILAVDGWRWVVEAVAL